LSEQSARELTLRRDQAEIERLQNRLDVLYDDRLDGRIDANTYNQKAGEIRQQQSQVRSRIMKRQFEALPPASQAVDLMVLTSKSAELFLDQPGAEQRKLIRLVVKKASWEGGELRMSLREPFSELRLSNRATDTNISPLPAAESNF
jgi:hypothetical protein